MMPNHANSVMAPCAHTHPFRNYPANGRNNCGMADPSHDAEGTSLTAKHTPEKMSEHSIRPTINMFRHTAAGLGTRADTKHAMQPVNAKRFRHVIV